MIKKFLCKLFKNNIPSNAEIYKKGYEAGFASGRQEALFMKYTPNQIRDILGFDHVNNKEKEKRND